MKITKKSLIKKCFDTWSLIIRSIGHCEICGKPDTLNAHHVIGRSNYALRFDLKNGCCLCVGHHKFNNNSAHENPLWFMEWFKSKRPDDYEYLKDSKHQQTKLWTISDYEQILLDLKARLNEIQSER